MNLPILDVQFFRDAEACYDPANVLGSEWSGTIVDILRNERIPPQDRIWAFSREKAVAAFMQRLFATRCVRRTVWDLLDDERSREAVRLAEKHALGEASDAELAAASAAARAAESAAERAAESAAERAAQVAIALEIIAELEIAPAGA